MPLVDEASGAADADHVGVGEVDDFARHRGGLFGGGYVVLSLLLSRGVGNTDNRGRNCLRASSLAGIRGKVVSFIGISKGDLVVQ